MTVKEIPAPEITELHKPVNVDPQNVRERIVDFLEHYCDYPLVDEKFQSIAVGDNGDERFESLLQAAGFGGDADGFLENLIERLKQATSRREKPIEVGKIKMPYHLLLAVLEELFPEKGYKTVKKVTQLESLLNINVQKSDREHVQKVLDLFPVRLSWHVIRQMRLSRYIAHQYKPFVDELDQKGEIHTWVGQFHRGIVEQMYQNRVIFVMNMACPVYCRFCFRKHKECRNQRAPTKPHVKQAAAYIREMESVKEIVLTGGDPFMNRATLQFAVQELAKIPHVQTLRLASRSVSYFPDMFLRDDSFWLNYLILTNLELNQKGKRLELATHFLHPDEVSIDALHIISTLVKNGVPVYVQTPYVKGCNETGRELVPLFNQLRAAGAEIHYIFMPTSPIQGNSVYWSPIAKGLEAARFLRAELSDRALPHITTATSIGKIDWNSSGWAVERHKDDRRYIWIRTPYTPDYFQTFTPIMQISEDVRHNAEGTFDARFMVDIGDEDLFAGPRNLSSSYEAHEYKFSRTEQTVAVSLESLQTKCFEDQRMLDLNLGGRPVECLARTHKAMVELDCGAKSEELAKAYEYIGANPVITDVVISHKDDVLSALSQALRVVEQLQKIPHVTAIRLRSLKLVYSPRSFSRAVINRLAAHNKLEVTRPCRLEIETQFLHSSEFRAEHGDVVRQLLRKGITVYNNTPLLAFINDNEEECLKISSQCRETGIEFCNIYVAGTPIQNYWNKEQPVDPSCVIDIATHLRRYGSGREVPRYLVRTPIGSVDFSIVPRIFIYDDVLRVKLRPHNLEYYRSIDPAFEWPEGVEADTDGHPVVPIAGLHPENLEFLFSASGD